MSENWCQSCAMPMGNTTELYGYEYDGTLSDDYCKFCYDKGEFTLKCSMDEMLETCIPLMKKQGMSEEESRKIMTEALPKLKRWQNAARPNRRRCCRK